MGEEGEKPLRRMVEAFDGLAATVSSKTVDLGVGPFSHGCSLVSPLLALDCLPIAFKIAKMDYVAKVEDLKEVSKSVTSLQSLLELDIENDCVRTVGSHSRNLLRVKRGLDMLRLLLEKVLAEEDNSLGSASVAYDEVFAPHHGLAITNKVAARMDFLPTSSQLLRELNEDEVSAKIYMQRYITNSALVIRYVEGLFLSRKLGIDW